MRKSTPCELTNMVMIENGDLVLVQERRQSWKGIAFPGGHVEPGESFTDSAAREILEETGLSVQNLKPCGVIHWENTETGRRYIVFLYRTAEFSGALLPETEEGRVFWTPRDTLKTLPLASHMEEYLRLFFGENSELYGSHFGDNEPTVTLF